MTILEDELASVQNQLAIIRLLELPKHLPFEKQVDSYERNEIAHGEKDEDMERKKATQTDPGLDFYERAYVDTIIPHIMGATSKQNWCYLTGFWLVAKHVKAAHSCPNRFRISVWRRGGFRRFLLRLTIG
jgi:hypothetical protein